MKFISSVLFLFFACGAIAQNNTPIGTWRMHLPYNSVEHIEQAGNLLYVLAEKGIYTFGLQSGEIELLTKVKGFSESNVVAMDYSEKYNTLVIGYENTNIDLLKDNEIINLPGIKRSSIVGKKIINEIKIYGKYAYLATSFGVVVIDIDKEEIVDDFQNLGDNGGNLEIETIAVYNDSIYLGSSSGIKNAPAYDNSVNLKNYASWNSVLNFDSTYALEVFDGKLYIVSDSILYSYTSGSAVEVEGGQKKGYRSLDASHGKLIVCRTEGIVEISTTAEERGEPFMDYAIIDHQDNLWFGGFYRGLIKKTRDNQLSYISPQGPFGINSFEMKGQGTKMWVSSGGVTTAFGPTFNGYGYYMYEDGRWVNRQLSNPIVGKMLDFTSIEINEKNGDIWLGSFYSGLARLQNGVPTERYDQTNSTIKFAPGDIPTVLGLALDREENLWLSNYETDRALVVRRKDGTWQDFNVGVRRLGEMIIDDYGTIWAVVSRNSAQGIMAFNEQSGRPPRILTTGKNDGGLPNNNVKALALDKDGEIWVGTETGLAIYYNPSLVFQGGPNADAQQIIIDDGNDVGYLLGNEVINDIKIDGANRKWIGTNNGVWLVQEDGSAVVNHFTIDNSPLPSNVVNCVGIVPQTGEVFFGTNQGIASFRSDATEAGQFHENTIVFPNPVHSTYDGPITISGLPQDATVKIVDVAGRVVYEMVATGGTAVWNGRNFNGERPQTGVYLIFSANKDDEDSMVSKLLLVR